MKTNPRLESNLPCPINERQLEDRFDDYLDDCYDHPECMGVTVEPHEFIKTHDETAYRCAFNDWLDSACRNDYIKEYDGSYYDKGDFESAVEATISEVETELEGVENGIISAQEKLNDFELGDPASEPIQEELDELEAQRDELNVEREELEDLK